MERPAERTGQVAERWAASRVRLAQCARRVRDFDRAIEGYDAALSINSRDWLAKFERGQSLCDARGSDLGRGMTVMQELSGPYINQFGRGTQGVLRALSDYGIGYCQYIQYSNASNKGLLEDLRETITTRFNMFTDRYERLTGDASSNADVPRGALDLLKSLAVDADRKLKSL
jgi:tetratricopeptide (TPR) repeat protein